MIDEEDDVPVDIVVLIVVTVAAVAAAAAAAAAAEVAEVRGPFANDDAFRLLPII